MSFVEVVAPFNVAQNNNSVVVLNLAHASNGPTNFKFEFLAADYSLITETTLAINAGSANPMRAEITISAGVISIALAVGPSNSLQTLYTAYDPDNTFVSQIAIFADNGFGNGVIISNQAIVVPDYTPSQNVPFQQNPFALTFATVFAVLFAIGAIVCICLLFVQIKQHKQFYYNQVDISEKGMTQVYDTEQ